MGNRVFKGSTVNGNRKYIVDISGELPTILLELDPNSGMEIKKTYIYANSQILAQHNGSYNAPRYFYLHDRLGSVRLVINSAGDVNNTYTYNPFGEMFPTECNEAVSNPFKFSGQFFDDEIGQYYLRARQYDPYIGRFTSRDPIDGKFEEPLTFHKYLYCTNNPINFIDPQGLWEIETHRSFGRLGYGPSQRVMSGGRAPFDYGRLDIDFPPWTIAPPSVEYVGLHFMSREEIFPRLMDMHSWQDSYVHYDRFGKNYWEHVGTTADDPQDTWNINNNCHYRTNLTTLILEDMYIKNNMATATEEGWLPDDYIPLSPWMGMSEEIINY
jgi:RHS repeat-associated protein